MLPVKGARRFTDSVQLFFEAGNVVGDESELEIKHLVAWGWVSFHKALRYLGKLLVENQATCDGIGQCDGEESEESWRAVEAPHGTKTSLRTRPPGPQTGTTKHRNIREPH